VKIVTWNVNGIRSVAAKGFHDFLKTQKPDVLGLQETKGHRDALEDALANPAGWKTYWSSADRKGYSGTALFCRRAPEKVEYGIEIPKFDAEGRFTIGTFDGITIYNVYFPNGGSGDERHNFKQEFLLKFARHLKHRIAAGDKIIVMGDYNVAYLDIDVFDPVRCGKISGFLPEERKWFGQFLDLGFIDTYRHFHPKTKDVYTWWSYQENGRISNRGWRIDHICVSQNLKSRLKSCEILDDQEGSDHCPVVLELS
jgi:exodeoxyribonuclease-3